MGVHWEVVLSEVLSQSITTLSKAGVRQDFLIRTLDGSADYDAFCRLERLTWGDDFNGLLNPVILMISQKVGGLAAGVFDQNQEIRGLIFGLTGPREGELKHWSHLLAVHPDFRDCGLGKHLKKFQRQYVLAQGVHDVQWTYDPLESKNALFNLSQLGALPVSYQINVYGDGASNALHAGIGTDRFVVSWRVADERVVHILDRPLSEVTNQFAAAPAVNTNPEGHPLEGDYALPGLPVVRVEIPRVIQEAKQIPGLGKLWRENTRRAFSHYMANGYRVVRFFSCASSQRSFYVLIGPDEEHP